MEEKDLTERLIDSVPIKEVLSSALVPPAQMLGDVIATSMSFIFFPLKFHSEKMQIKYQIKLENFLYEIGRECSKIPTENLRMPEFYEITPIFDEAKNTFDHEWYASSFAKLIASYCDKENYNTVHPEMYSWINRLSPRDAEHFSRLLNHLLIPKLRKTDLVIHYSRNLITIIEKYHTNIENINAEGDLFIPLISSHSRRYFTDDEFSNLSLTIETLERLGIIERNNRLDLTINLSNYMNKIESELKQDYLNHHELFFMNRLLDEQNYTAVRKSLLNIDDFFKKSCSYKSANITLTAFNFKLSTKGYDFARIIR